MKPPELKTITIRTLRRQLLARQFAIPKLQRGFVWDPGRAAKLLDSIYRNMPIGSLFLWRMDRKSANLIRQSDGILPPFRREQREILFVIDGQQRLSVLHQIFEGEKVENDAGRQIDFSRVCFVANPDPEAKQPARIVYRKPSGRDYISLRDILDEDWRRRVPNGPKTYLAKIKRCREEILSYPVPVVTVTGATLDEIGEVFIRVNAQGMRITSADRALALMGALDVRAMAQELRNRVREHNLALDSIDPILMGFNLVTRPRTSDSDPPKLEAMAKRWSREIEQDETRKDEFSKLWDRYLLAFTQAVDYLRENFHVYDETFLPSANMPAVLAVFFFHSGRRPNAKEKAEIRKWFWATGIGNRYSGSGYHRNIVTDARFFEDLTNGKRRQFAFDTLIDADRHIKGESYSSRSSRSRSFFCLLAAQQPKYLENGDPIPLRTATISHADRTHRHHIFPRRKLSDLFTPEEYNSLCNICFLPSRANLSIGQRVPHSYLGDYRDENRRLFAQVMRSHLIPVGPDSGVWEIGVYSGYPNFRRQRLNLICDAFEKEAGIKLFRTNRQRT